MLNNAKCKSIKFAIGYFILYEIQQNIKWTKTILDQSKYNSRWFFSLFSFQSDAACGACFLIIYFQTHKVDSIFSSIKCGWQGMFLNNKFSNYIVTFLLFYSILQATINKTDKNFFKQIKLRQTNGLPMFWTHEM